MRSKNNLLAGLLALAFGSAAQAAELCEALRASWNKVQSYETTYRAVTLHEGERKESLMKYSYMKKGGAGLIRMDIEKPKKGAVLIYNPEVSEKVRIRPFPKLPLMVLDYELTHRRVSSGDGGTVDKSDLGHRMEAVCAEIAEAGKPLYANGFPMEFQLKSSKADGARIKRVQVGADGLIRKIETIDDTGKPLQTYEWTGLKVNPPLDDKRFQDF